MAKGTWGAESTYLPPDMRTAPRQDKGRVEHPRSPPTAAAGRRSRLLVVIGANRPPTAAQIAHAATCDARKSTIFGSEELMALRAVALPAARDGSGRIATSFLTTPARGTRSQTAIPRRANDGVLPYKSCAAQSDLGISRQMVKPVRRMSLLDMPDRE